ncbi:hypothetical protein SCM19_08285 [Legionella pneumophila serogroup 1]
MSQYVLIVQLWGIRIKVRRALDLSTKNTNSLDIAKTALEESVRIILSS